MASLTLERGERTGYRLRYQSEGKQKSIWIGATTPRKSLEWKEHIEILERCRAEDKLIPAETEIWFHMLDDSDKEKVRSKGLYNAKAKQKRTITLVDYLETYFAAKAGSVKARTQTSEGHVRKRLETFFDKGERIDEIDSMDAKDFAIWLEQESNIREKDRNGLAQSTVRRRIRTCKSIFQQACDEGLITKNPFSSLKSSMRANKDRMRYIDLATMKQLLEHASGPSERCLIALARVAGLRMPSEVAGMLWSDIDFDKNRMLIRSPKTGLRTIPLFPAVKKELKKLAKESESVFPNITGETNMRGRLLATIKRANLTPWPKIWQNLRSSAATDLVRKLPMHVAIAICGHSAEVAKEHYWQVTDEDMESAIKKMH